MMSSPAHTSTVQSRRSGFLVNFTYRAGLILSTLTVTTGCTDPEGSLRTLVTSDRSIEAKRGNTQRVQIGGSLVTQVPQQWHCAHDSNTSIQIGLDPNGIPDVLVYATRVPADSSVLARERAMLHPTGMLQPVYFRELPSIFLPQVDATAPSDTELSDVSNSDPDVINDVVPYAEDNSDTDPETTPESDIPAATELPSNEAPPIDVHPSPIAASQTAQNRVQDAVATLDFNSTVVASVLDLLQTTEQISANQRASVLLAYKAGVLVSPARSRLGNEWRALMAVFAALDLSARPSPLGFSPNGGPKNSFHGWRWIQTRPGKDKGLTWRFGRSDGEWTRHARDSTDMQTERAWSIFGFFIVPSQATGATYHTQVNIICTSDGKSCRQAAELIEMLEKVEIGELVNGSTSKCLHSPAELASEYGFSLGIRAH